jgi:hypothetical protein
MAKIRSFFDDYTQNIERLRIKFGEYKDGVFEDPENILALIESLAETLYADIIYHRAKLSIENKKRLLRTEMESKAMGNHLEKTAPSEEFDSGYECWKWYGK